MIKPMDRVMSESTCLKRITVCEIYDKAGNLLSRESNRCDHGGECKRMGVTNTKSNYPADGCNWTHAEVKSIAAVPKGSNPYKAVLYGHSFYCEPCETALKSVGIKILEIV
jgi:deoxycytidylate deaminase